MNNNIQAKELYDHFLENNSPRVIDLRDGDDYGAGHIPGALNIPYRGCATVPDLYQTASRLFYILAVMTHSRTRKHTMNLYGC